jgi:hypothetical protein
MPETEKHFTVYFTLKPLPSQEHFVHITGSAGKFVPLPADPRRTSAQDLPD